MDFLVRTAVDIDLGYRMTNNRHHKLEIGSHLGNQIRRPCCYSSPAYACPPFHYGDNSDYNTATDQVQHECSQCPILPHLLRIGLRSESLFLHRSNMEEDVV